jgi:23S rRNA maturation-related 3'-5' exoribonuclease YhaM
MNTVIGVVRFIKPKTKKVGWSTVPYLDIVIQTTEGWKTLSFEGSPPPARAFRVNSLTEVIYLADDERIIHLRSVRELTGPQYNPIYKQLQDNQTPPSVIQSPLAPVSKPLMSMISKVQDPTLKHLLTKAASIPEFHTHQAALKYHHAYEGGLLQHSLAVANRSLQLADQLQEKSINFTLSQREQKDFNKSAVVPLEKGTEVNRDLLITGSLLHDIGKLREYTVVNGSFTRNQGELEYHTSSGQAMVDEWASIMKPVNIEMVQGVRNIIASHHVKETYGARENRLTPEALLVSMADGIDASAKREVVTEREEEVKSLPQEYTVGRTKFTNTPTGGFVPRRRR